MKFIFKLALVALFALTSSTLFGQKFGYINSEELISLMPELVTVTESLEKIQNDLSEQLELMQVEYNNKYLDFQKNAATFTESIRQMKENELQSISQRFEEFRQSSVNDLQKTQSELMKPVIEKAKQAIDKVSAAHKFTIVYDQAVGAIIYFDAAIVTNILPLVKKELGIPEDATPPLAPTN